MRYYCTPIRIAQIQKTDNTKYWQGSEATGTLIHCWWKCKMVQPLWEKVWQFLKKTKHALTIWYNYYPPWYLPKEVAKMSTQKPTNGCLFIAALIIIVKTRKQPRCPSLDVWINSDTLDNGILFSTKKKWAIKPWKRQRGNLNAYY